MNTSGNTIVFPTVELWNKSVTIPADTLSLMYKELVTSILMFLVFPVTFLPEVILMKLKLALPFIFQKPRGEEFISSEGARVLET